MTLVGAASAAQLHHEAADFAYRFNDASYRSSDSRELDEHGGLPGVPREYRKAVTVGKWGAVDYVNTGIEGYGWGALNILLLIRYLLGFREEEAGVIQVAPVLPQVMRRAGATYRAGPVSWGKYLLHIECAVRDVQSYIMRVRCAIQAVPDSVQEMAEQQWEWEGAWGAERILQLP